MVQFEKFSLENGLTVIVHPDPSIKIAVLNVMYNVGSKDEEPHKTGFAHLFEHLMFGGSQNIENFDEELQKVGGENNAFTSPDITNYYITLPSQNIETAFWLESDRMLSLSFNPKVLEVQRKVVIEEFKQRYLNQPYGDVWLKLRDLVYDVHPYKWPTIGKEIQHIEDATMEDVKAFFFKYYVPSNAILCVGGNVTVERAKELAVKWFGPIASGEKYMRNLPKEPIQTEKKFLSVQAAVPSNALYMAFKMEARVHEDYFATDLMSDLLGRDKASILYIQLVKERELFTSISAYITGSMEPGLVVISGMLKDGVSYEEAESAVWEIIATYKNQLPTERALQRVKNQALAGQEFGKIEVLERCINLCYGTLIGDTNWINKENDAIQEVTPEQIQSVAQKILTIENCSVLHYASNGEEVEEEG